MSVVIAVTFKAKDDTYDELHATLKAILPDTARYEGAELISCSADPADKTFYIHEVWDSAESQKAYLAWRQERGDVDKLVALLRDAPSFEEREHLTF